jgi:hypothetical protein
MKRLAFVLAWAALLAAPLVACNDVGDCPASSQIKPGGSCSGDQLQCPYTLDTPSPACDGTMVEGGLQTSCTCVNGTWSCPSAVSCDATTGEDASQGGDAGDGASMAEAATDASSEAAASDARTDASGD